MQTTWVGTSSRSSVCKPLKSLEIWTSTLGNLVKELRTVTGRLPVGYRSLNDRLPVG